MKIIDYIINFLTGRSNAVSKPVKLQFPALKHTEFVLLRVDRNTGIVLNERLEYARNDHRTVYKKFDSLSEAIDAANELVSSNPTIEIWLYDHRERAVYSLDVEEEKFHKVGAEFDLKLKKQVLNSTMDRLLSFALDISERLLPEYLLFYEKHQWGNPDALIEAIQYCKTTKIENMEKHVLKKYCQLVDEVIPDTEDFGDCNGSYALNAGCAVISLLEFLIYGERDHILAISTYMTDTVDFKLSEADPNLTDAELCSHSDLIKEMSYQLDLLK